MINYDTEVERLNKEHDNKVDAMARHQPLHALANALETVLMGFGYRDVEVRWSDVLRAIVIEAKPRENHGFKELAWLMDNVDEMGFKISETYESGMTRMYTFKKDGLALRVHVMGGEACKLVEDGIITSPRYKLVCAEK